MKKLMLLLSFFTFTAIAGVNAQCSKSAAACCAKKSSTSASTTAVSGDAMVKKVANTSETKAACCAKGEAKSCKKDASACQGAATGKVTEATPAASKTRAPKPVAIEAVAPTAAQEDK